MPEACTSHCATCTQDCAQRDLRERGNPSSNIQKVIAVVSGKGGVGKSTVTAALAVAASRRGAAVGILDADITGPSIPTAFGVHGKVTANQMGILPAVTPGGIRLISLNLLMANETDPVIWRGPVIAGVVTQFWNEVVWGELDVLFVDLPPGTGDVPLTVFQSLPVDGIVVVTSPQDLVSMIVTKAVNMAHMMEIPILGIVENYSYFQCPGCGKRHAVFGESHVEAIAEQMNVPVLARLPMDPALTAAFDGGTLEQFSPNYLDQAAQMLFPPNT